MKVQTDREFKDNLFARSDQYSFAKAGIPALAFKFGYRKGDQDEVFQDWYARRYHSVKDNMSQPIDLEAAAQFNELLRALVLRIADEEEDRRWREHSFFRRFGMHPGM